MNCCESIEAGQEGAYPAKIGTQFHYVSGHYTTHPIQKDC